MLGVTFQMLLAASGVTVTPASNTFLQSAIDTTNATTYTFTSQNVGTADATRRVIVAVTGSGSASGRTISSATIGGVGATLHVNTASASNPGAWIISALVPTGTTATVSITMSGSMQDLAIGMWRQINETVASPHATQRDDTLTGTQLSVSINIPTGGCLYGVAAIQDAALRTWTWGGATERYDQTVEAGVNLSQSGASETGLGSQTGRSVTADININGGALGVLAAMSWG